MMKFNNNPRFSLRKFSVGLASVLIGMAFLPTLVSADEATLLDAGSPTLTLEDTPDLEVPSAEPIAEQPVSEKDNFASASISVMDQNKPAEVAPLEQPEVARQPISDLEQPEVASQPAENGKLAIITEAAVPEVKDIVQRDYDAVKQQSTTLSLDQIDTDLNVNDSTSLTINFEPFEQPVQMKQTWTNQTTGKSEASIRTVEKSSISGEVYKKFSEDGVYQLKIEFLDLENNPLAISAESQAKFAAIPLFHVTTPVFTEPKLVDVSVDKTTVKKGEDVTYTLVFEKTTKDSPDEYLSFFYYNTENQQNGWMSALLRTETIGLKKTNRYIAKETHRFSDAGLYNLMLDDSGYFSHFERLIDGNYIDVEDSKVSQALIDKLAELSPKVRVLDEVYQPVSLKDMQIVSSDGSIRTLTGFKDEQFEESRIPNYTDVTLHVGDKLVYHYQVNDDRFLGGSLSAGFESDSSISISFPDQYNIGKEVTVELPILSGLPEMIISRYAGVSTYVSNSFKDSSVDLSHFHYRFNIVGTDYKEPKLVFQDVPKLVYNGESYAEVTVQIDPLDAKLLDWLSLGIQNKENPDAYGSVLLLRQSTGEGINPNGIYIGKIVLDHFNSKSHAGTYELSSAEASYTLNENGGLSVTRKLDPSKLPDISFKVSDEKVLRDSVLLSKEENDTIASINHSNIYSNLGRLPKELQNRNLNVEKIVALDKNGQIVSLKNAEIYLTNSKQADSELYYYYPITGRLQKLSPERLNSTQWGVKDLADTDGVFVTAYGQDVMDVPVNNKVLSTEDATILVNIINNDVTAISSMKAVFVDNKDVLAKLPTSIKAKDVDMYDIKMLDKNGDVVQITSDATVTLPVDPSRKVVKVVYYLPETGAIEELNYDWNQEFNQVTFKVTHFSDYGVVYEPVEEKQADRLAVELLYTELKTLLEQAQGMDKSLYTSESYDKVYTSDEVAGSLASYLSNSYYQAIASGSRSLQEELDAAVTVDYSDLVAVYKPTIANLRAALKGLVATYKDPETPATQPNKEVEKEPESSQPAPVAPSPSVPTAPNKESEKEPESPQGDPTTPSPSVPTAPNKEAKKEQESPQDAPSTLNEEREDASSSQADPVDTLETDNQSVVRQDETISLDTTDAVTSSKGDQAEPTSSEDNQPTLPSSTNHVEKEAEKSTSSQKDPKETVQPAETSSQAKTDKAKERLPQTGSSDLDLVASAVGLGLVTALGGTLSRRRRKHESS